METAELLKLLEELKALSNKIDALIVPPMVDPYESAETKDINGALAKAQGEYPVIGSNKENPYFKSRYTDLDAIMRAIRLPLAKNGLSFTQQIRHTADGATVLHSKLRHSSGQWIESRNRIVPAKNDMQTLGSTLSYLKRYAAMALLNITCSEDPTDDDAEVAMVSSRDIMAKGVSINTKYNPKEESSETITKEQLDELEYELAEYPDVAEQVLDGLKIQSLCDMPKSKYSVSIRRIREIKNARNNPKQHPS